MELQLAIGKIPGGDSMRHIQERGLNVDARLQGLLSHRMERPKDHVYIVAPRIFEDLVAISQVTVKTVHTNTFRRVRENSKLRIVV
jgi:hypothetical protein